jgi:hypothetical protein
LNFRKRLVGEWLHPPGPPTGKKNNPLSGECTEDSPFDCIQLVRSTLACHWNFGECYGWPDIGVSRGTARKQEAEAKQEGLPQTALPGVEHLLDLVPVR